LLRKTSKISRIADLAFERIDGDVRDYASVRSAIEGCTHAIHLAAIVSWHEMESREMTDVALDGTRNVLRAARESECARTVYISSIVAIGNSEAPRLFNEQSSPSASMEKLKHAKTKMLAEQLCIEAARNGQDVVIVNPAEVYGPKDIFMVTSGNLVDFTKSSPVLVCAGGTAIVHVEDVAKGIVAALEKGRSGERYILGGENLTVRELAELTLRILKRNTRVIQLPNSVIRFIAWLGRQLRLPLPFNPQVIPYATRYWFMDNTRARNELNVRFRSPEETLRPALQWLLEQGYIE
jgi:dihydroflavonol-4-reductase